MDVKGSAYKESLFFLECSRIKV